jgi:hypothetical protein
MKFNIGINHIKVVRSSNKILRELGVLGIGQFTPAPGMMFSWRPSPFVYVIYINNIPILLLDVKQDYDGEKVGEIRNSFYISSMERIKENKNIRGAGILGIMVAILLSKRAGRKGRIYCWVLQQSEHDVREFLDRIGMYEVLEDVYTFNSREAHEFMNWGIKYFSTVGGLGEWYRSRN